MARKRLTKNQKQYQELVNHIRELQEKAMSMGYVINDLPELSATPKRITQSMLQDLSLISYDDIIEASYATEEVTSQIIVDNFISYVAGFPAPIASLILSTIRAMIQEQGINQVAYVIENMPQQMHYYLNSQAYATSSDALSAFIGDIINLLPDATDDYKAALFDLAMYDAIGDYE